MIVPPILLNIVAHDIPQDRLKAGPFLSEA